MEELRESFFPIGFIESLSLDLANHFPEFNAKAFSSFCSEDWFALSLKERQFRIVEGLHLCLQETPYSELLKGFELISEKRGAHFSMIVFPSYVERYGLEEPTVSLKSLAKLTRFSTAEFALRPFIEQHEQLTKEFTLTLCQSNDEHERRLASEGWRPLLPWGKQLTKLRADPSVNLLILEVLKTDQSLYVRKSVANHLNDISKDHPEKVIGLLGKWLKEGFPHADWLAARALRTLRKDNHPQALALLGLRDPSFVKSCELAFPKKVKLGKKVRLSLKLDCEEYLGECRIDFQLNYPRKNAKPLVKRFLLAKRRGVAGKLAFEKEIDFADKSTRRHYPGKHNLEIVINGQVLGNAIFELVI